MKPTEKQLEEFVRGYLFAMEWAEEEQLNREGRTDVSVVHPDSLSASRNDCEAFVEEHFEILEELGREALYSEEYPAWECLGHDFYFTRNGHGVGYWSRDFNREETKQLAKHISARVGHGTDYPPVTVYVGDDGFIHID